MIDSDQQTALKNQFEQIEHQGPNDANNKQLNQQQTNELKQEKLGIEEKKGKGRGDEYDSSPSSQREPTVQIFNDSDFSSPRKLEDSSLSFTQFQPKSNNEFKIITMSSNDYQILNKGIKTKKGEKHRNNNHTNSGQLTGSIKNKLILNEDQMNNPIKQVSCFEQEIEYKQTEEELKTPHSIAMPKIITILDIEEEHIEDEQKSDEEQEDEYCDTIMDIQSQIIYNDNQKTRNFARTVIDIIKPGKQSVTYQSQTDVQDNGLVRDISPSSQNSEVQPNQTQISNIDKSSLDNQSQQIIVKNQSHRLQKQNKQSEAKQGKNITENKSKKSADTKVKSNKTSIDGNLKNITFKNNNSIISVNSQNSNQQIIHNTSNLNTKNQQLGMKKQQTLNQLNSMISNTDKMLKQASQSNINDHQFRNSFSNTSNTNSQQKFLQTQKKTREHIAPKDPSNLKRNTTQKLLQKSSQLATEQSALSHQSSIIEGQQLHQQFRFDQNKNGQKSRNQKSLKLLSQDIYQNIDCTIIQSIQTIDSQNLDYSYKNQEYSPQILVKKQSSNMNEEISYNEVSNSQIGISQSDCKLPVISISDFDADKQNYQFSHQSISKFKSSQKLIMDDDTQKSPYINLYQFNDNRSQFLSSNDDKSCTQLRQSSKNINEQIGPIFTNNSLDSNSNNIKVVIRIRPFNNRENEDPNKRSIVEIENEGTVVLLDRSGSLGANQEVKRFYFDFVGHENIDQKTIFNTIAKPIANSCLQGYNGTIFAYGQTGAGKTFTIQGPSLQAYVNNEQQDKNDENQNIQNQSDQDLDKDRGIMQRSFEYIFQCIQEEKQQVQQKENGADLEFLVKCSFLEIYNEQIMDLLEPSSTDLKIREDINKGVYVEGLAEEIVCSHQDMITLINHGVKNRHVGATNLNIQSSRSHSVLTTIIESKSRSATGVWNVKQSRFHIIDLAGSERQKIANTVGDRLKEAGMINKSLSSLGNVINSLVDVSEGKNRHVPYRDSKLTFILRDSLGGNSKTAIIANISPSHLNLNETLSTLKFAQRAKLIKNKAVINEDSSGTIMLLKNEIKKLKKELNDQQKQVSILQNNCQLLQQNENLQTTIQLKLKGEESKLTNKICKMCKKDIQTQLDDMNGEEDVNELDISIEDRIQKTNELVYSQSADNNEDKSIDPFSPDRNSLLNIKLKTQGIHLGRLSTPIQVSSNANILDYQLVKKYQNRILTLENLLQSKLLNFTQNQKESRKIQFLNQKLEAQMQMYDNQVYCLKDKIQEQEQILRNTQKIESQGNFEENMNEIKKNSDNLEQIGKDIKTILQTESNYEQKDDYIKIIEDLNEYISSKCSQQAFNNLEKELNVQKEENKSLINEYADREQKLKENCDEMQNQLDTKTEDCIKLEEDSERITRQFARVKVELQDYINQIGRYEDQLKSKDLYISQLNGQKEEYSRLQNLKIEDIQNKFIDDMQRAQSQIIQLEQKIETKEIFICESRIKEERSEMTNNELYSQFIAYQAKTIQDLQCLQNTNINLNEDLQKEQINNQVLFLKMQEVEDQFNKLKDSNQNCNQKINELENLLSQQINSNTEIKIEQNTLQEQITSQEQQTKDQIRQISEQKSLLIQLNTQHQNELDSKNVQIQNEFQKSKELIEQLNKSQESHSELLIQFDKEKENQQLIIDQKHQEIIQLKNQLQLLQESHDSEMKLVDQKNQLQIKELKQVNLVEQESNQKKDLQSQNMFNKQIQDLKVEIDGMNQEIRSRILETECKQFELSECRQELEKVKNAHERSQEVVDSVKKSLESVRMHVKEQESLIQKQKEQIVKAREDLVEKEKLYQNLKLQLVHSQQETEKEINRMTLQLQQAQFIQQEYDFCQNQLNNEFQIEKQKQLGDLNVQISTLQKLNEEQKQQINQQILNIREEQTKNQNLKDENSNLNLQFQNSQREKEEIQNCNNNLQNQLKTLQQNIESLDKEIQNLKVEQQKKEIEINEQQQIFDNNIQEKQNIKLNELLIQKEEINQKEEKINQLHIQLSDKIQKQLELKDIMDQKDILFQEFQISEQTKQNKQSLQFQNLELQLKLKTQETSEQIHKLQIEIENKNISLDGQFKLIQKQQEQIDQLNSKIKDLINQLNLSKNENEKKNIEILKVQNDYQTLHLSLQEQQTLCLNKDNQIINLSIDIQNLNKQNLEYQNFLQNSENNLSELNQNMNKVQNDNQILSQNLIEANKNEKELQNQLIKTKEQQEKINQLHKEQKLIMDSKQQAHLSQIQSLEFQIQEIKQANNIEIEILKKQIISLENEITKLKDNSQIKNNEHQEQQQNQVNQHNQQLEQQQQVHEQLILNLKENFNFDIQNMQTNHDQIINLKNQVIQSNQSQIEQILNKQKQYEIDVEQSFSKEKQQLLKEQFQKQQNYLNEIDEMQDNQKQLNKKILNLQTALDIVKTNIDKKVELIKITLIQEKDDISTILEEMERIDETISSAIIFERGMGTGHAESSGDSNCSKSESNFNEDVICSTNLNLSITSIIQSVSKMLQKQINCFREKAKSKKKDYMEMMNKHDQLSSKYEILYQKHDQISNCYSKTEKELQELKQKDQKLAEKLREKEQEIVKIQRHKNDFYEKMKEKEKEIEKQKSRIEQMMQKKDKIEQQFNKELDQKQKIINELDNYKLYLPEAENLLQKVNKMHQKSQKDYETLCKFQQEEEERHLQQKQTLENLIIDLQSQLQIEKQKQTVINNNDQIIQNDNDINNLKDRLEEQNILIQNTKQTNQDLQDDLFEKENQISQIQDQICQIMQKYDSREIEIKELVKTLKNFKEENCMILADRDQLLEEIEMLQNNQNNCFKIQAHLRMKEENSKCKKDVIELQKQVQRLKKDPRVSEQCNCNESAVKLRKQFRTLISHILSLIQIDYIIQEEGLKIEQLNDCDEYIILEQFQTIIDLMSYVDSKIFSLKQQSLTQPSRTVIIPPTTKSACTQILEKYHSSSRILNKGNVLQAFGSGEATNISQTDNSIVNGGIHLPHQDNLEIQYFQERRDGYFKQSCVKDNSFIIGSTEQLNTQRRFNDHTVICLPQDVRECSSKQQYQILNTGGNSETAMKKNHNKSYGSIEEVYTDGRIACSNSIEKEHLSGDILVQNMGHSIINKNQERLKDSQNSQMKKIHQKSLDSPIILNSYSSLYINKNNNNFNRDFFKNNNQISARRVYSDQKQIDHKNNLPNPKMRELEKQKSNEIKQLPNTSQMTNSFNANKFTVSNLNITQDNQQQIVNIQTQKLTQSVQSKFIKNPAIIVQKNDFQNEKQMEIRFNFDQNGEARKLNTQNMTDNKNEFGKKSIKKANVIEFQRKLSQQNIISKRSQQKQIQIKQNKYEKSIESTSVPQSSVVNAMKRQNSSTQ